MNDEFITDGYCTRTESATFESKRCEDKLPKSIWETYSAFANTNGGDIILGFTEMPDKRLKLTGVCDPEKIVKEFWNLIYDGHKVSSNLLTDDDVSIKDHDGLSYIIIHVPRAERHRRPVYINNDLDNGTYKRNESGDYHCTVPEILEMGRDASETTIDQRIIEGTSVKDVNMDTLNRFRNIMRSINAAHPWLNESDEEFLRLIGAADELNGELALTQAGLLMFGNDYRITRIIPSYHLDYQEYHGGTEWTDRFCSDSGLWSGNLFDFYMEVSNRLFRSNRHPFSLKKDIRIDDNDIIKAQREAVLNGIIHADYMGQGGIVIRFSDDSLYVRNPGCFRIPPAKAIKGGYTDARNPQIMKMFTLTGFVERAGSGIYRIIQVCSENGLRSPTIIEDTDPSMVEFTIRLDRNVGKIEDEIESLMKDDPKITMSEIADRLSVSKSTVYRAVMNMKETGRVERLGGPKGRWILKI